MSNFNLTDIMPSKNGKLFAYDLNSSRIALECLASGSLINSSLQAEEFQNHIVILIGGLGSGLLDFPYHANLLARLPRGTKVLQPMLSSSLSGWGTSSLNLDGIEIQKLCLFVCNNSRDIDGKRLILIGHSTGCQDILWLLSHNEFEPCRKFIKAVILQAPVSDREYLFLDNAANRLWEEAKILLSNNEQNKILSKTYFNVPITAYRLCSLLNRLGDDDYFSTDLTEDELSDKLKDLCTLIPIHMVFSGSDQYVPDFAASKLNNLIQIYKNILTKLSGDPNFAESKCSFTFLDGADHSIRGPPSAIEKFVDIVEKVVYQS